MIVSKAINANGSVPTVNKGPIYVVPDGNIAVIKNLKFNNTDTLTAYTIAVYQLINGELNAILLYKFDLDAGDYVDDDSGYELQSGTTIQAVATVSTVVFAISGYEQIPQ